MSTAVPTYDRKSTDRQQLLSLTRVARQGWEAFVGGHQGGLTDQMRLELRAMRDVASRLVSDEPWRVEGSTAIESDFYRLTQQWERERPHGADVSEMVMHTSYQRIIGMGPSVVPLLLKELERKPGHWFWALYAITGGDPVPLESQGHLKEMAAAWIAWGKKQGYSW
jgi:hypothetical protein